MMKSNLVKIIRNYKSDNEEIQDNVKAIIQPEVSFFDLDADIKRLDYVIIPNIDEPLVVEKVKVYEGRPPFHKEVILINESKFHDIHKKSILKGGQYANSNTSIKNAIVNNFTVNMYLNALEKAIEQSDIPKGDKKNLIKKIREIKDNPYLEDLSTSAVLEVKQIFIR